MLKLFKKTKREIDGIEMMTFSYRRVNPLIPCKMCGRYDEEVRPLSVPTGVFVGYMHPWCASQMIHDTMKELVRRMS